MLSKDPRFHRVLGQGLALDTLWLAERDVPTELVMFLRHRFDFASDAAARAVIIEALFKDPLAGQGE